MPPALKGGGVAKRRPGSSSILHGFEGVDACAGKLAEAGRGRALDGGSCGAINVGIGTAREFTVH
jgi:hypothetical protein